MVFSKRPSSINFRFVPALFLGLFTAALQASDSIQAGADANILHFEEQFRDGRQEFGTIEQRMRLYRVPGLCIAVLKDYRLLWAKGYGVLAADGDQAVTPDTLFSVGSVSKLVAAAVSLRLVDRGDLHLDSDVNRYLTRWRVPMSRFTQNQSVTLRHILSHTAGFTIHGFRDFQPGEPLPSTLDTLNGRPPAIHPPVTVDFVPGSAFRYSGGGITVEQLMIEEVTGHSFPVAAKKLVFEPLGMQRSSYQNPLPAHYGNIARAHGRDGRPRALPRGWEAMPEMAASGLWTSATDLARFISNLMDNYHGRGTPFLGQTLVRDMMTPVPPSSFGLGPELEGNGLFSHGGANDSYKAHVLASLHTGTGIIVLTNSANGQALIREILAVMKKMQGWP